MQALAIWHRVVSSKRATPRAIKRYLNRVRYFAMRQRGMEERIPDSLLVAMSAIHHTSPNWFESSHPLETSGQEDDPISLAVVEHAVQFDKFEPTEKQIALFRSMSAGINVH